MMQQIHFKGRCSHSHARAAASRGVLHSAADQALPCSVRTGGFSTLKDAAMAYDRAAIVYWGEAAKPKLNVSGGACASLGAGTACRGAGVAHSKTRGSTRCEQRVVWLIRCVSSWQGQARQQG